jgi:hypothetical protein
MPGRATKAWHLVVIDKLILRESNSLISTEYLPGTSATERWADRTESCNLFRSLMGWRFWVGRDVAGLYAKTHLSYEIVVIDSLVLG